MAQQEFTIPQEESARDRLLTRPAHTLPSLDEQCKPDNLPADPKRIQKQGRPTPQKAAAIVYTAEKTGPRLARLGSCLLSAQTASSFPPRQFSRLMIEQKRRAVHQR